MISRIQIRAEAETAHAVEGELRWCAARIESDLGLSGDLVDQVIEGTPGKKFEGRVTLSVTSQDPSKGHAAVKITSQPDSFVTVTQ